MVSCRQLKTQGYLGKDASDTKEASRAAANAWLLDRLKLEDRSPTLLERKIAWARENRPALLTIIKSQQPDDLDSTARAKLDAINLLGGLDGLDADTLNQLLGEPWKERLAAQPVEIDESLEHWFTRYLVLREAEIGVKISPSQ